MKRDVLQRIDDERTDWQRVMAEVGKDCMLEPGPMGEWSFKDLASHLRGWRAYSISRLESVLRGEGDAPFPWPSVLTEDDEINRWIYDANKDRPLAEVLAEFDATHLRLRTVVEDMPHDLLFDPDAFPWMEGESVGSALISGLYFGHWHEEHEPDIRAWLAAKTS